MIWKVIRVRLNIFSDNWVLEFGLRKDGLHYERIILMLEELVWSKYFIPGLWIIIGLLA